MQNELEVMHDVALRLEKLGIPYMLTGSMAMNVYTEPRMTRDIDIVVAVTSQSTGAIVRAFTPDYYVSEDAVRQAIASESIFNLLHQESIIKIDCIVRKSTAFRLAEFERRKSLPIGNFYMLVTSKEDLIISKLWWAKDSRSEMQMRDIKNLINSGCDMQYVEHWTKELGLFTLWQEWNH